LEQPRRSIARYVRVLLPLAVIAALAPWAWRQLVPGDAAVAKVAPPVPVGVARAARADVAITADGLGTVTAQNSVAVRSQVDGQLKQVMFREGQEVRTGDILAQIDPRTYQAQLEQAGAKRAQDEALLANARRDLARYSALLRNEYATRQQVDTTQAQVHQLEAAVKADLAAMESAKVLLGYTTIRSPIDGRAGFRQVDPGNIVHVNDAIPMVSITQMKPITVVFTLGQDALPDVIRAMAAGPLAVDAFSRDGRQKLDSGHLELVDNQIDPATGTIRMKAIMANDGGLLWPGQFVNARLTLGTRTGAVTVPASAVLRGQQGAYVYVVKGDGTAWAQPVVVARADERQAVIDSGIGDGDTVVTEGQMRLKNGAKVDAKSVDQPK
jgi:multidrug efflux system membrane fusion protein